MRLVGRLQAVIATVVVALLFAAVLVFTNDDSRTVTAHFDRAIAVYPGTDLRVMGVQIGKVTEVIPDGNSVRVKMTYDAEYSLPADAQAAVVTPTLVADRFVQVFPAYGGGAKMADNGDIPLERTQTPVELDRMFKTLDDLSTTLGPKNDSTRGALTNLLAVGAKTLEGNGQIGGQAIRDLSAAADTFARNRGPLFDNVRALAEITETLAVNDETVRSFLESLASASEQLADERTELNKVLEALAEVLGPVKKFISQNREVLGRDITLLASILERIDRQKDALGLVTQKGALAMGNLAVTFEPGTGTFGSRVQITPGIQLRPDQFICQVLTNNGAPPETCALLGNLLTPLLPAASAGASGAPAGAADPATQGAADPSSSSTLPAPGAPTGVLGDIDTVLKSLVDGVLQ